MNKINENEFMEAIRELKDKSICITLKEELEGKVTLYKMDYEVRYGIIKLIDKESNNYININLSQIYKTLVNHNRDRIQINTDITVITIEKIN